MLYMFEMLSWVNSIPENCIWKTENFHGVKPIRPTFQKRLFFYYYNIFKARLHVWTANLIGKLHILRWCVGSWRPIRNHWNDRVWYIFNIQEKSPFLTQTVLWNVILGQFDIWKLHLENLKFSWCQTNWAYIPETVILYCNIFIARLHFPTANLIGKLHILRWCVGGWRPIAVTLDRVTFDLLFWPVIVATNI